MELGAIDEGECEAVGEGRAEFFHEIESETGATGTEGVEEADLRVESDAFCRADAVVGEEDIEEGKECVHGVARWAAVSAVDVEICGRREEHRIEGVEVSGGGFAFESADSVEVVWGEFEALGDVGEVGDGGGAGGVGTMVADAALEDGARIEDFTDDEGACERGGFCGVGGGEDLCFTEEDVAGFAAVDVGEGTAVFGEKGEMDAAFGAEAEEKWADEDIAEADDGGECVDGEAEDDLVVAFGEEGF